MKKAMVALILLICFTASAVAQDYRLFPPPQPPYYEKTMAPQEVWIYDATVKSTDEGYVFSAKVKAMFYAGLDPKGNRIEYNTKKDAVQDDPSDFELIDEVFVGEAFLKVGLDSRTVARTNFKVTGGDGDKKKAGKEDGIIEFKPINKNLKLLPTRYKIVAAINPGRQRFRNIVWTDKEERKMNGSSSSVKIIRDDPRRAIDVSVDAFILVRYSKNGNLETYKEGAINFYETALAGANKVEETDKKIEELKTQIANENDYGKRSLLEVTYYALKVNVFKYKYWAQTGRKKVLEEELKKAKKEEWEFKQAVHSYDRSVKVAIVNLLNKISDFNKEVYYTSYGCMPGWRSSNSEKMKKMTKEFKIDKYLSKGKPGIEVEQGSWKSDKWLDNLEKNWMEQIKGMKEDFRKIFGTAMTEDSEENKNKIGYYGMNEDGSRTFWEPVLNSGYQKLYEFLFKADLLTKTIKSLANILTEKHNTARVVKYPYVKEGTSEAEPSAGSAYTYSQKLGLVKKTICGLIYSCAIPNEELINPEDIKKKTDERKTEWVCPSCGTKSAFKPHIGDEKEGKCPVCGTTMEEKPITIDDGGIGR